MNCFCKNRPIKRILLAVCLVPLMLVASLQAERLAVVSVKPTNQLLSNVQYLLEATGTGQLGQFFMPQVTNYLQGIDGDRPIGVVLNLEQGRLVPLGFLPVTDLQAFLSRIQDQVGEPLDAGNGILEIRGPQSVFVKEENGWAFLGQTTESLQELPEDPSEWLDGLSDQYDISVRAFIANVPDEYKQMLLGQVKSGVEQGMRQANDPNASRMAEAQIAEITRIVEQTDQLTIGWRIDSAQRLTHFDFSIVAQPGTELAQQMDDAADATTDFAAFLMPDAAISGNLVSVIPEDQIEQTVTALDSVRESALREVDQDEDLDDENARQAAKQLIGTFFDIFASTIKTGKIDSCTSVIVKPQAMTLLTAAHVADGSEVESAVKQLVDMAQKDDAISLSNVEFNADTHQGVRLHTLAVNIPEGDDAREVFGPALQVVVGASDQSAYVALGADCMSMLKACLDDSASRQGETVEPFNLTVSMKPLIEFAQTMDDNPALGAVAQVLSQAEGKDHLRVRAIPQSNGLTYRVELEEGLLKAAGMLGTVGAAGGF